jgi:hypothetical protein
MRQTTLLAALLFAGSSLFAADPQLLAMAPSDATTYAGINVTQAKTSQFGQFLLNNIPQNADIQTFITKTGFDPRTDLTEVLMAATLTAPAANATTQNGHPSFSSGLVLAKGTFNIPKIVATAGADQKVQLSTYAGVQLLTIDGTMAFGLIDASTAAVGDLVSVKAALDRRTGPGSAIDSGTMARINELSTTEDAWSVSTKGLAGALPMLGTGDSGSAVLQSIQQSSGGIKFGSSVVLTVQVIADSTQDAASLSDVVKMLSQMASMHSGTGGAPSELTNLLKGLTISTDGTAVNLSLTVAEDQLEALVKMAHGSGMAAATI